MSSPIVFVDMDGVLFDFTGDASRVCGFDSLWTEWDMQRVWGMSDEAFWSKIDAEGDKFWHEMTVFPWFGELLFETHKYPWRILSSPSRSKHSVHGKIMALQTHFGEAFRDWIFCPKDKHLLCKSSRSILIDDNDKNCRDWELAGGFAILFPQPWNLNRVYADDPMGHVRLRMKYFEEVVNAGYSVHGGSGVR